MTTFKTPLLLLTSILTLTACGDKAPPKTGPAAAKVEQTSPTTPATTPTPPKGTETPIKPKVADPNAGGQPPSLLITGLIVKGEGPTAELDVRIHYSLQPGTDESGVAPEINSANEPELTSKTDLPAMFQIPKNVAFITQGCTPDQVRGFSSSKEVKTAPALSKDKKTVTLNATKVLLCGKVNLGAANVVISAKTLILMDLDMVTEVNQGTLNVNAENLVLVDANKMGFKVKDRSTGTNLVPPSIMWLQVQNEIHSLRNGELLIVGTGSNFAAPAQSPARGK